MPIIPLLLNNWQLILKCLGGLVIGILCYWYFIHNPKVIDGLEQDKAELQRQVEVGKRAQTLLEDIQKGRQTNVEKVDKEIAQIKSEAIPRRIVLITGGVSLPPLPAPRAPTGTKPSNAGGSVK